MDYIYLDGVQVIMCRANIIDAALARIIETTKDTWQKRDGTDETSKNTKQGKEAEKIFEEYAKEYDEFGLIPYDEFRKDKGNIHAPFDELLYKKNKVSEEVLKQCREMVLAETSKSPNGQISKATRNFLREHGIYTVEVKSTNAITKKRKLTDDDKDRLDMLIELIRRDDFFVYPHFCRNSNVIETVKAYFEFVKASKRFSWKDEDDFLSIMFREEFENASDIVIRMYLDDETDTWYMMGYMLAYDIIRFPNIKKFKCEKSEAAVYFTKKLTEGKSVNLLFSDSRLWDAPFNPKYGFEKTWQLNKYLYSLSASQAQENI